MIIKSITFKNFLCHKDLTIVYGPGLNVVRGSNEKGKSSSVEGIGYLFFGATALIKSVEDTLNDEVAKEKKNTMRVTGEVVHEGQDLTITRSPAGAEVKDATGRVLCTGQKQVTAFVEKLMNLPAGRAQHLMMANQNEIRGVLALGPTAASEFIEKLADFSEVDQLIKRIVMELPHKDTDALAAQISTAKKTLAEIVVPEIPDHSEEIKLLQKFKKINEDLVTKTQEDHAKETAVRNEAIKKRDELKDQIILVQGNRDKALNNHSIVEAQLNQAESLRTDAEKHEEVIQRHAAREIFEDIQTWTPSDEGDIWEGTVESLSAEIDQTQTSHTNCLIELSEKQSEIKVEKAKKIIGNVCPYGWECNSLSDNRTEAKKINAAIDTKVTLLEADVVKVQEKIEEASQTLDILKALQQAHTATLKQAKTWPEHLVEWDRSIIPHGFSFRGEIPNPVGNIDQVKAGFLKLQQEIQALPEDGEQALAVAAARAKDIQTGLSKLEKEVIIIPEITTNLASIPNWLESANTNTAKIRELEAEIQEATGAARAATADKQRWENLIAQNKAALTEQQENTVFIKALKQARLKVSEKLWNTVMGGISNYFSRLRGRPSLVSRDPKGFLIDGKPGRPSGSTLDILGLALRIVMIKIFADSGLMIIDEPSAGCDLERTANMTAVLQSAEFEQVVWVSHDDVAEAGAAKLIEL